MKLSEKAPTLPVVITIAKTSIKDRSEKRVITCTVASGVLITNVETQ